jgi:hypothetical protein
MDRPKVGWEGFARGPPASQVGVAIGVTYNARRARPRNVCSAKPLQPKAERARRAALK